MATAESVSWDSGRKRKHEEEETAESSPAKKSKGSQRSERRRARLDARDADAPERKDRRVPLGDHKVKTRTKGEIKRERRKQERAAAASGEPIAGAIGTVLPDSFVDFADDTGEDMGEKEEEIEQDPKERRKQKKQAKRAKASEQEPDTPGPAKLERDLRKQRKREQRQLEPLTSKTSSRLTVSDPIGGRFIHHDPIFVRDAGGEEYIIASVARELQVLSVQTSLLVRTLPARKDATILGFAVVPSASHLVHVAQSRGGIFEWDWTNDLPARFMGRVPGNIKALATAHTGDDGKKLITPYITRSSGLHVVKVPGGDYETKYALHSIQLLNNGHYVVACGAKSAVVGARKDDKSYTWVELPLAKPSTCMDARVIKSPAAVSKKAAKQQPQLQLAIGNDEGQIQLYDDVSPLLAQAQQTLPEPRTLHWHRSAVSSVKFSPDGNYLISGGKETVLVLWQLGTGKRQYVPHLMSEIERISVNAQGDRYALQMGDNSIMVLSTAELKPVANFAGLQMQTNGSGSHSIPAACLHPTNPKQLMLTVPESRLGSGNASPRPFLQTFDLRTTRHVARQALTRTNATDRNTGPDGQPISVPDVHRLAISQDGQWLATVDEWMPPAWDLEHLASNETGVEEARRWYRQVFLKFWQWDSSLEIWTLVSRADNPHRRAGLRSHGAGQVLALVSDPVRNAFTTVGEDGCVKIWKPKTRLRGGVPIKDAQDVALLDWTCRRSVQLLSNQQRTDDPAPTSTAAAYSDDGSLLAVSTTAATTVDETLPAVAFIVAATGEIQSVRTDLADGTPIHALAFLERYLITATHKTAFVWDLVGERITHRIKLLHKEGVEPQIAVSSSGADKIFALVTPAEKEKKASRMEVYSTREEKRLFRQEFKTEVVRVLAAKEGREFVLLFADATVRSVPLGGGARGGRVGGLAAAGGLKSVHAPSTESDGGLTRSEAAVQLDAADVVSVVERDEDDRPVVTPQQLEAALGVGDGTAMPLVKDMFRNVMRLFARKP